MQWIALHADRLVQVQVTVKMLTLTMMSCNCCGCWPSLIFEVRPYIAALLTVILNSVCVLAAMFHDACVLLRDSAVVMVGDDVQTLCRWIMSVKMNYHDFLYHNWQHVVTVMQTMFAMITVCHIYI